MTTSITSSEIKIFFIQIMYVAITGLIIGLYLGSPPVQPVPDTSNDFIDALSAVISSIPFVGSAILGIVSYISELATMIFWIPDGLGDQWIVIALIKVPFDLFDIFIGARIIKDYVSGWT